MPLPRWTLSLISALIVALPVSVCAALPTDPLVGVANGNGKAPAGSKVSPDQQTPQSILADLQTKLPAAQKELKDAEAAAKQASPPSGEMLERQALLQRLVRAYEREIDHRKSLEQARERRQEAERRVTEWQGFPTPPPYSILMLDELRDAAHSTSLVIEGLQAKLALSNGFSERAQQALAASEKDLRQASERLEAARDPAEKAKLNKARDLSRLRNRAAAATATMTAASKKLVEEEIAEMRQRSLLLDRQIQAAAQHILFSEQDLAKIKKQLDADQAALENEVAQALAEHPVRQEAMAAAAAKLREAEAALPPASARTGKHGAEIKALADAADLTRLQFDNVNLRIDMLRHLLDVTERVRRFWEIRFEAAQTTDPVRAREAYDKIAPTLQTLQASRDYLHRQVDLLTSQINDVTVQLEQPASPTHAAHLREVIDAYRQREQLYRRMLPRIDEFAQLIERWKVEFAEQHRALPIAARVEDWRVVGADMLRRVWEFELFAAEDTIEVDGQSITGRRSVTVGKAVRALAILIVGYWICLVIARLVERLAVKRLGIDHNLANILRQWMMVLLFAILLIVSLIYVKIPLTVFAFLGGALAIGVGFGTQTLLKNFISGILLLIERPLRLGDLIEVDGIRGRVTHIGFRSSTIREGNGMEMLIPNSNLLEKNLNNWTYSTARTRFTLRVGVAYESPTDRVRDLLLEGADRHGLVLKHPAPQVLFRDLGDNTLVFDLRFWLDIAVDVDSDVVASDLRFMIAKVFPEAGILFAFPQRDVHLTTARPLHVQVVDAPREAGNAGLER